MHKEQLEYFTLVYQMRNFSAAAKLVPMSPQGLAKSIHSLENELKVPLFTDVNGALTPTVYADEFLRFANSWGIGYQAMKESFKRIEAHEHHEIRLGSSLGIIGFLGTELLGGFHEKHPRIKVEYNESNDIYCEKGLLAGTYDLAFTLSPYGKNFITTELYATQTFLWANSSKWKTLGKSFSITDLEGQNLGVPGKDFKIYETIIKTCETNGVALGELFTSSEIFWLYEYVSEGKGLAFSLPHLINLSAFSNNKEVIALPLEGVPWKFGISYLSSHSLSPHEKTFLDYCINYARCLS